MSEDNDVYQKRDIILAEMHNDIKHLVKNFDKHVEDDKKVQDALQQKVEWVSKIFYMGLGAIAILEIGLNLIK